MGLAPSGRPHPATKWSLLMALLVVTMLGVPGLASAGQPSVQAPTGTQSSGVFTSTYTFVTYIYCAAGYSFNSSYSNDLEGTHNFVFYGAPDGSLLVAIDGGGLQLITSCGDPFAAPQTIAASYSVTKYNSPPPPSPSATPTPTPQPPAATPPPAGGAGSPTSPSAGASSGGGGAHSLATPRATPSSTPSATPQAAAPASSSPGPPSAAPSPQARIPTAPASSNLTPSQPVAARSWISIGLTSASLLLCLLLVAAPFVGSSRLHRWLSLAALHLAKRPGRKLLTQLQASLKQRLARHTHGHQEPKRRGLSHHHHTGRLLAHHHTSYPALAFLVLLATVVTTAVSLSSRAAESVVSLTVLGPAPTVGATIDQPITGQVFTTAITTVRGTCPAGLMVEIYRNNIFAGSVSCENTGLYNLLITLTEGQNQLVARDLDGLGQYGPDSATVTVDYNPPLAPSPTPTASAPAASAPTSSNNIASSSPSPKPQTASPAPTPPPAPPAALVLFASRHYYAGLQIGEPLDWEATFTGGIGPFHASWDWGDGTKNELTVQDKLAARHVYDEAGIYRVLVRLQDSSGREAALTLVAVVNGGAAAAGNQPTSSNTAPVLVWPLLAAAGLAVASFWLGERHKLAISRSETPAPA